MLRLIERRAKTKSRLGPDAVIEIVEARRGSFWVKVAAVGALLGGAGALMSGAADMGQFALDMYREMRESETGLGKATGNLAIDHAVNVVIVDARGLDEPLFLPKNKIRAVSAIEAKRLEEKNAAAHQDQSATFDSTNVTFDASSTRGTADSMVSTADGGSVDAPKQGEQSSQRVTEDGDYLMTEDGDYLLTEDGVRIEMEGEANQLPPSELTSVHKTLSGGFVTLPANTDIRGARFYAGTLKGNGEFQLENKEIYHAVLDEFSEVIVPELPARVVVRAEIFPDEKAMYIYEIMPLAEPA